MSIPPITYRLDKGAPLNITEFDNNITALRDRSNHTGTQLAASISDLNSAVEAFDYITALQTGLTDVQNELNQLTTDILANAGIAAQFTTIANKFDYIDNTVRAAQTNLASLAERVVQLELFRANILAGVNGGQF